MDTVGRCGGLFLREQRRRERAFDFASSAIPRRRLGLEHHFQHVI